MNKEKLEEVLATVNPLLTSEGVREAAELVRAFPARTEQTGYDNWNGGTEIWDVQFEVPPNEYARLNPDRQSFICLGSYSL